MVRTGRAFDADVIPRFRAGPHPRGTGARAGLRPHSRIKGGSEATPPAAPLHSSRSAIPVLRSMIRAPVKNTGEGGGGRRGLPGAREFSGPPASPRARGGGVCPVPGCPTVTGGGRCALHARDLERARPPSLARSSWYHSARWRRLRHDVLRAAAHRCANPTNDPACEKISARLDVDHIRDHRNDPKIFFDRSNLQALCKSCHTKKTHRGGRENVENKGLK